MIKEAKKSVMSNYMCHTGPRKSCTSHARPVARVLIFMMNLSEKNRKMAAETKFSFFLDFLSYNKQCFFNEVYFWKYLCFLQKLQDSGLGQPTSYCKCTVSFKSKTIYYWHDHIDGCGFLFSFCWNRDFNFF